MESQTCDEILELRRTLHQFPECSGKEKSTSLRMENFLRSCSPDHLITNIGGHGLAAAFQGETEGPTILLRAELDALPIQEKNQLPYRSKYDGVSHMCGHDGHMAILAAVAKTFSKRTPMKGRVILLFQPAEETGEGARAIVEDPKFNNIRPDFAFSLHNVPGLPMGVIATREGMLNCASRGVAIRLLGKTSHAAHPEYGLSPAEAVANLIYAFGKLNHYHSPLQMVTLIHSRIGEIAFGTAPGEAEVMATLRTENNAQMEILAKTICDTVNQQAKTYGLQSHFQWHDVFEANQNHPSATRIILKAAQMSGLPLQELDQPWRWSEDFGVISRQCKGAMFGLGSGLKTPQLHNPNYDFPEALIPIGQQMFLNIIQEISEGQHEP